MMNSGQWSVVSGQKIKPLTTDHRPLTTEFMQAREKISEPNTGERRLELVAPIANLAYSALTQNAKDRSKIALVWESAGDKREVYSFFEIEKLSNKIANVLNDLETGFGDRVFTLLRRTPELYAAIPAVLKIGAAVAVLFPDFGPEAIRQRLEDAGAAVLITDAANLEKVRHVCGALPSLKRILIVGDFSRENLPPCDVRFYSFDELVRQASSEYVAANVSPDDTCFLI